MYVISQIRVDVPPGTEVGPLLKALQDELLLGINNLSARTNIETEVRFEINGIKLVMNKSTKLKRLLELYNERLQGLSQPVGP